MVLIAIGKKLVAQGVLDAADDVIFFRYNELRVFMGDPSALDGRALVAQRKAEREKAYGLPAAGTGSGPSPSRSWTSPTSTCGASPISSDRTGRDRRRPAHRHRRLAGCG